MKKVLLSILIITGLLSPFLSLSQSFWLAHDTVYINSTVNPDAKDSIFNNTSSPITLKWQVIGCDFPPEWLTPLAFGICDNVTCYNNSANMAGTHSMQLWNDTASLEPGDIFTSAGYSPGWSGAFNASLNLPALAPSGTHFFTVQLTLPLGGTKTATFIVYKPTNAAVSPLPSPADVLVYPNPAVNEVNVVFDASSDVKNIAVYNIIGRAMSVYKVSGSSANLNIENMPSGVYFMKLYNSVGHVVATRKFTKQ